jgi:LacI family transcriptional regulator, galactose operon repressor
MPSAGRDEGSWVGSDRRSTAVRRVTLHDVAARADVSLATASRGYRRHPSISLRTQQLVIEAADELGYVPNAAARSLVLRTTRTLALLIPDMGDPIHGQIAIAFEQEATRHGYSVIISNAFNDPILERRALQVFTTHRVDGIAAISGILDHHEALAAIRPTPSVFVNSEHMAVGGRRRALSSGAIQIDEAAGMEEISRHLRSRGYRTIGYVPGPRVISNITRRESLARALRRDGDGGRLRVFGGQTSDWRSVDAVAAKIVDNPPEALVCYDDKLGLAVMDALRKLGMRVPDDLAVVGFDDIPFAQIANPRLTTVAQPSSDIGRRAVTMLLAAIDGGTIPPSEVLPVRLMVRESTGVGSTP